MAKQKQQSPIERHAEVKAANPGVLILLRVGDFYETFGEDAEIAARVLGLTLTTMTKGESVSMVGFPSWHLDAYLTKLIKAGYRCSVERGNREPLTVSQTERVLDFMGRQDDREQLLGLLDAYWGSTCDGCWLEFMKGESVWWVSEIGSWFEATVISHDERPDVRIRVPALLEDDMCADEDDVFKRDDHAGVLNRLECKRLHILRSITGFERKCS